MVATGNPKYWQIWLTVQQIPYGKVATYGQIADLAGLPGRARLVGKALQQVPKSGVNDESVPWHRVINSQGKISLPFGSINFIEQQQLLLAEGVMVKGAKVQLKTYQWQPDLAELLYKLSF